MLRNSLESLDWAAGTAPNPTPLASEIWSRKAAEADADLIPELDAVLAGLARQGLRPGEPGAEIPNTRRNALKGFNPRSEISACSIAGHVRQCISGPHEGSLA